MTVSMYPLCHGVLGSGNHSLMLALFLGGLTGSLTHCAGMCGPFALAQAAKFEGPAGSNSAMWIRRLLLPYHLGRATSYSLLGVVVSFLTIRILHFSAFSILSHLLLFLAGSLFIASAFTSLLPNMSFGFCGAPSWLMTRVAALLPSHSLLSGYVLGVLLGFIPCGLVYAALFAVAATANPWEAAAGMAIFAAGTAPVLILISLGGQKLLRIRQSWVKAVSSVLMLFNGITLFLLAGKGII